MNKLRFIGWFALFYQNYNLFWNCKEEVIENSSELFITGIYKSQSLIIFQTLRKTYSMEIKNQSSKELSQFHTLKQLDFHSIKTGWDLPKLYTYLQTIKDLPGKALKEDTGFANLKLIDIGTTIVKILNCEQTCYDKHYVGAMCVFVSLINIRNYSTLLYRLRQPFFQNIPFILKDICQFWSANQNGQKFSSARAKLIAYFSSIIQISSKKKSFCKRIYSDKMLNVLASFQLPNDDNIIKLFSKMVFQSARPGAPQNKILAINLLISLKHSNFPVKSFHQCMLFIMTEINCDSIEANVQLQIVRNLKQIIYKNFQKNQGAMNLCFLILFISKFFENQQSLQFRYSELIQYCKLVKKYTNEIKIKIYMLRAVAVGIVTSEEGQSPQEIDAIMSFTEGVIGLQILPDIISKISSACLFEFANSGALSHLIKIGGDIKQRRTHRVLALRGIACLAYRMHNTNYHVFAYLKNLLQNMVETIKSQSSNKLLGIEQQLAKVNSLPDLQFSYI